MARYAFRLPDIGEGVAEAEIVAWHVRPGDAVREDQPLADIMTDKATVEITSPVDGVVTACHGEVGGRVMIGAVLVDLEVAEGDAVPDVAGHAAPDAVEESAVAPPVPMAAAGAGAPAVLAAPATRARAVELGIALESVTGTGPDGRITPDDLERAAADKAGESAALPPGARTAIVEQKIIGLRRVIADRLSDAARRIPHFLYVEAVDMTALEAVRAELNAGTDEAGSADGARPHLTLLPFLMRALARLQPEFPRFNARYADAEGVLHLHEGVHIGIATQTAAGLMVPVVRHVEARDVWDCARELARVTQAARDGRASRSELSGSTITLTSLGSLGGLVATPIINPPEVAIIGPNRMEDRPVVRDGQMVVRRMMNISSSFDHRIIDGHDAALFIQRLKALIEAGGPF